MESPEFGNLPKCELVRALASKAKQRHDTDFDFLGRLKELRKRVSAEVSQINLLFPEYTPHNEEYHLKNLFRVADTVLGQSLLEKMNAAELFVLAAGLYGHDWGMAVSKAEKKYITTGRLPDGATALTFAPQPDEPEKFRRYARQNGLTVEEKGDVPDVPDELWRGYVRKTHAQRSGARIRKFFEADGGGVGTAAARVCEGHWLDFEELRDFAKYPTDFGVLSEQVNLRAMAVYVRLIDLLDIGDDRTPYVLWKFVDLPNPTSRMEWEKHRALHPITCPRYQTGRVIRVDGSTEDYEVYAALQDLRIWCEKQLRGCNDTLAQMNDDHHRLDIFHIDWCVKADGFKPVSIQFEFDRARMFDILGDEIYEGDPYVFLRELLQNSIDAIRTRREVLKGKGVVPENFGAMYVNVKHGEDGDAVITWRDDGIGMDESVVRNYLAIAGKSYYHSKAFKSEGLNVDPISQFGIGILSCFMVADELRIETFRDPYVPGDALPLRIKIPAPSKQFRIETFSTDDASTGTTVKVFVKGEKLPKRDDEEGSESKRLHVTEYLSIVAGFVEFPIVITEGDRKTIVLHPYQNDEAARSCYGADFEVHQLDLSYPWEDVFYPQDLHTAKAVFEEHTLDMCDDLDLEGYEGKLLRVLPRPEFDFRRMTRTDGSAYHNNAPSEDEVRVRYHSARELDPSRRLPRSARLRFMSSVYRDGILLSGAARPKWLAEHREGTPQRMVVNLPKSKTPRVDLARTMVRSDGLKWDAPIWNRILEQHFDVEIDRLCSLDPHDRLLATARLLAYDLITVAELWDRFPQERWPILEWLGEAGSRPTDLGALGDRPLCSAPRELVLYLGAVLRSDPRNPAVPGWITNRWKGEPFVIETPDHQMSLLDRMQSLLTAMAIRETYVQRALRFLVGPSEEGPPIAQKVYVRAPSKGTELALDAIAEIGADDPAKLKPADLRRLTEDLLEWDWNITAFEPPYQQCYAYGHKYLNSLHPTVLLLVRVACAFLLARASEQISKADKGRMHDCLARTRLSGRMPFERVSQRLREAFKLARRLDLVDIDIGFVSYPKPDDFVTDTIVERNGEQTLIDLDLLEYGLKYDKKSDSDFGMPLS